MENVIVVTDNAGLLDGWTEAALQMRTPEKAQEVLRYFAMNPPSDAFDVAAQAAAIAALGH
jgi:hypothetical protein